MGFLCKAVHRLHCSLCTQSCVGEYDALLKHAAKGRQISSLTDAFGP